MTRLTQVSHKAPMRLVPVWKSSVEQAGAAVCALSNYGGGMLQGDSVELHVNVKSNARLGVTTQGASRIYTQRVRNTACKVTLHARVDPNALLVWAPDPCALFRSSSFQQTQHFNIDPTSSVALIDWFSSGRYRNGEHWAFDQLTSRTCLTFEGEEMPFLQDAIHMDLHAYQQQQPHPTEDPLGVSHFHAFASLILYGDQVDLVRQQCEALSDALMLQHTRIRERAPNPTENDTNLVDVGSLGLAGRICMGSSRIDLGPNGDAHVVRLAATTNEDLYRIFHHCLHPLHPQFGMEFYKDRIRAKASEIPRADKQVSGWSTAVEKQATILSVHEPAVNLAVEEVDELVLESPVAFENSAAMWSAFMLADSALPTGSFAHSAGLEVAAQMGMITSVAKLENFVQAATRSTLQITSPFLVAGHELASRMEGRQGEETSFVEEWKRLDRQTQAVLASNAPACAASLDQGKSLARVAQQWLESEDDNNETNRLLLECFDHGCHVGPVLGAIAARLGLTTDQVGKIFGFCVARDMVSAAVRLSLVGPLASVKLLRKIQSSSDDGWKTYLKLQRQMQAQVDAETTSAAGSSSTPNKVDPMMVAAACAPVIEAIHPCHESLQVRLFRT
jgi:urease accessory protein